MTEYHESNLKTGDILLLSSETLVGKIIREATDSTWTHSAILIDGEVWEQDWPCIRHTPVAKWLRADRKCLGIGVLPITWSPITPKVETDLETWWTAREGMKYGWPLLIAELPVTLWQRLSHDWSWLPFSWRHIQPPGGKRGVCSVCIAWSLQAAGITMDESSGMTPYDLTQQMGFAPVARVVF